MKRLLAILALLLMAGCVKDDVNDYDVDMPLAFRPTHYGHSQAAVDDTAPAVPQDMTADQMPDIPTDDHNDLFPTDMVLGVTAWQLDEKQTWAADAAEAVAILDSAPISYDGVWTTADEPLWPSRHNTLTVIGYAPHGAATRCTREEGVVFTADTRTSECPDIMFTPLLVERTKFTDGGRITLPFRHALAEVEFRVRNQAYEGEGIVIRSIKVDGVAVEGTFHSLPEPTWRTSDTRIAAEFFSGTQETSHTAAPIGKTLRIIPQDLRSGVTIEYDYRTAAGTTLPVVVTTNPLKLRLDGGRRYTLTLAVSMNAAKVVEQEICNRRLNEQK